MPTQFQTGVSYVTTTAVIATSSSITPEVDCGNCRLVGIQTDGYIVGTQLTFQVAAVSGGEGELYSNAGVEVTYPCSTSEAIPADIPTFLPWEFIKVRTGTSGSPTTQGTASATTLTLILATEA